PRAVRVAAVRSRRTRVVRRDGSRVDGRRWSAGGGVPHRADRRRTRAGTATRVVRGSGRGGGSPGIGGGAVGELPGMVAPVGEGSAPLRGSGAAAGWQVGS